MKRADLILFNKELLQRLKEAGVRIDDYRYSDMYDDYVRMTRDGMSRKAIVLTLAEQYDVSDRQVYNIIRHMETPV